MGNLFCPIISSHITGFTRTQLVSSTYANDPQEDIQAYATDSILIKHPLSNGNYISDDLGEMKSSDQARIPT